MVTVCIILHSEWRQGTLLGKRQKAAVCTLLRRIGIRTLYTIIARVWIILKRLVTK